MPVIVHCPPNTYAEKEIYIYGDVLRTRKEWLSRLETRLIHTIEVKAAGGLEDEQWSELTWPAFITATDSDLRIPHCRYPVYEYLEETVEPPKPAPPKYKEEPGCESLERINKRLRKNSEKLEREGYMDDYKLGTLEPEWDE